MDADRKGITGVGVAAAARQVGVGAATLRAWERRYGLRPSGYTSGGHRRYSGADIATLSRVQTMVQAGMPTATAAALGQTPAETSAMRRQHLVDADGYAGLAAAGESLAGPELARIARAVLGRRGVVAAWEQVFAPYLQALGRYWSATGRGIECEHLAVAVLQSVLRKDALRRRVPGSTPRILLAAAPGELHTLPLDALAAALAEAGLPSCTVYDLPAPALRSALERSALERSAAGPLVVWSRGPAQANVSLLRQTADAASASYAAGPGWRADRLPAGIPHLRDLSAAVAALRGARTT